MGTAISWLSTSYTIPALGEDNWGTDVTNYLIALSTGALSKSGGSFTLTAETDFGANFGLKSIYYKSRGTVSTAGILRLANNESIGWRNQANGANLELKVNTSNILEFNGNPIVTLALGAANTALKMNSGGTAYEWGLLANANIDASAAIALSKLAAVTASRVLVSDASGFVSASSVTSTTLGYLDATSSIQTQIDGKEATITGAATTITGADLTASRALVSDGDGKIAAHANTTSTEVGYLNGVTSAIQTQIDAKLAKAGDTMTGNLLMDNAKEIRFSETDANGSHYIGLKAPDSVTSDATFVLPNGDGSANQVLKTDGSKNLGWATVATVEKTIDAAAGTSGVTLATTDEDVHVFTPSSAITVKLNNTYAAGRIVRIINNGSGAGIITLTAHDDSVIRQVYPKTVGSVICVSSTPADSDDWEGLDNIVSDTMAMANPTITGFGTPTNIEFNYQRIGAWMHLKGGFTSGVATTTAAIIALPFTMDFSKLYNASGSQLNNVGTFFYTPTTSQIIWSSARGGAVSVDSDDTDGLYLSRRVNSASFEKDVADDMLVSGQYVFIDCWLPITGWTPKKG